MSYISCNNLNSICVELTNWCNAACPQCSRFDLSGQLRTNRVNNAHTTLDLLKSQVGDTIFGQIQKFWSCGTYGDAIINPECLDIYRYVRQCNNTAYLNIHTNGAARNQEFWQELAELDVVVFFGIDGLQDTNHLYRRGVSWNRLMQNVETFISAGGRAHWRYLIFKHNVHQIQAAAELAQNLGFMSFEPARSSRWQTMYGANSIIVDNYIIEDAVPDIDINIMLHNMKFARIPQKQARVSDPWIIPEINVNTDITCRVNSYGKNEIYIRANGDVQPCCMLNDLDTDEVSRLIDSDTEFSLRHHTLEEILNGQLFQRIGQGIERPGPNRLQTCVLTCGSQKTYTNHISIKPINPLTLP